MSRRIAVLTVVLALALLVLPGAAMASSRYSKVSKKWRGEVRRQLKAQHVWTMSRENTVLRIITRESGGSETARNGSCVGLLQFNNGWKHNYSKAYFNKKHIKGAYHKDARLSGSWSIRRIARVYRIGGSAAVRSHWIATI